MSDTPQPDTNRYEQFIAFRTRLNERLLGDEAARGTGPGGAPRVGATLVTKRFFNLDGRAYEPGALDTPTKELLGLVASMVLRCDDCVAYHIDRAKAEGVSDEALFEAFDIALIVGGSIVIPHLRRAVDFLDQRAASVSMALPNHPGRPAARVPGAAAGVAGASAAVPGASGGAPDASGGTPDASGGAAGASAGAPDASGGTPDASGRASGRPEQTATHAKTPAPRPPGRF